MAAALVAYVKGPYLKPIRPAAPAKDVPAGTLQKILVLLRTRSGHDFSSYKLPTILRRIERRMNVHQIGDPGDYLRYPGDVPHVFEALEPRTQAVLVSEHS